jgi:hypothetical protein
MLAGGLSLLALASTSLWIEEGELAALSCLDARGRGAVEQLWIVDVDGATYVRAASADASWVQQLGQPVRLTRGRSTVLVRAVALDDAWTRRIVDRAMHDKYGLFDSAFHGLHAFEQPLPVRLEPITAASQR